MSATVSFWLGSLCGFILGVLFHTMINRKALVENMELEIEVARLKERIRLIGERKSDGSHT